MYKDIYREKMDEITSEFELDELQVLHGRSEICTDARTILIYTLSKIMSDAEIEKAAGLPRSTINTIKNRAYQRLKSKYTLRKWLQ